MMYLRKSFPKWASVPVGDGSYKTPTHNSNARWPFWVPNGMGLWKLRGVSFTFWKGRTLSWIFSIFSLPFSLAFSLLSFALSLPPSIPTSQHFFSFPFFKKKINQNCAGRRKNISKEEKVWANAMRMNGVFRQ